MSAAKRAKRGPGKSLIDWQKRKAGGGRARFVGTGHHADQEAASLRPDHPAVVEGRTLFPTRVVDALAVDRVLVSGHNNAKIGAEIEKGPWAGMPIYTLTLEERATCPRTCENWHKCMGNAMPMPRRHRAGPELIKALDDELRFYARQGKFAVRLHILGDFYSAEYCHAWIKWMQELPQLHVWGYTARLPGTPYGSIVAAMNLAFPTRWRMRFSVASDSPVLPMQVTTIWRQPSAAVQPEGHVCPQSIEKTATCGTCGLCWAPDADRLRIAFVGHGMRKRGSHP